MSKDVYVKYVTHVRYLKYLKYLKYTMYVIYVIYVMYVYYVVSMYMCAVQQLFAAPHEFVALHLLPLRPLRCATLCCTLLGCGQELLKGWSLKLKPVANNIPK